MPSRRNALIPATAFLSMIAAAGCATSAARPFSFHAVEFMSEDQREPAAQQFVADAVRPGMPLPDALSALRHAGLYCRPDKKAADVTECRVISMQHTPESDLDEVWWVVRVSATPSGEVKDASVSRKVVGL